MMYKRTVYLGLGSNLRCNSFQNTESLFNSVIYRLNSTGLRVVKVSNNWISSAIPFTAGPLFLNKVIKCVVMSREILAPKELFHKLCLIEKVIGKKKLFKNSARLIDLDIIDYGGLIITGEIILPHPRMHERKFVLNPLETIDKNWMHPKLKSKIPQLRANIRSQQYLKEILT